MQEGIHLEPNDPENYRLAANALAVIGDRDAAIEMLDRGLSIDPTHESLLLLDSDIRAMTEAQRSARLFGILTVNPRQELAAHELESLFWRRRARVAWGTSLLGATLVGVAYATVPESPSATTIPQAVIWGVVSTVWFTALNMRLPKVFPKGFTKLVVGAVKWARIGAVLAVVGAVLMVVSLLGLAAAAFPTSPGSPGDVSIAAVFVGMSAVVAASAELVTAGAKYRSRDIATRNRRATVEEVSRIAASARVSLLVIAARVAVAAMLIGVALLSAGATAHPAATLALIAVAVCFVVPALVAGAWELQSLMTAQRRRGLENVGGRHPSRRRDRIARSAPSVSLGVAAILLGCLGLLGAALLLSSSLAEYDEMYPDANATMPTPRHIYEAGLAEGRRSFLD